METMVLAKLQLLSLFGKNFPSCLIEWKDNEVVNTYVYNRNFVNENFGLVNPIKWIFTLGKGSVDLKTNIDELKEEVSSHQDEREKINNLYIQKEG
ncbi:AAA family ATPase [Peribacillus frigoritolerans]|nr:AAA family ATPase [Peribacillus frigoritolerans]